MLYAINSFCGLPVERLLGQNAKCEVYSLSFFFIEFTGILCVFGPRKYTLIIMTVTKTQVANVINK